MEKEINIIETWLKVTNSPSVGHREPSLESNTALIKAIYALLEEKAKYSDLFDNTLKQLFQLIRSEKEEQCSFVYLFIPNLIHLYLCGISRGDKKSVSNIEVTLLALYNKEVLSEKGLTKVATFRLPTLARQSVYHEADKISSAFFTTDSLQRYEAGDAFNIRWGPSKQLSRVTAAYRYNFLTALLVSFNARLSKFPKITLMHLVLTSTKLVCQGFTKSEHLQKASFVSSNDNASGVYSKLVPRIPVTSDLLAELVHAVYFAICNGVTKLGMQTLDDLHTRAQYELFPDVILMTNAVRNSVKQSQFGSEGDVGTVGITLAHTTTTSTSSAVMSKSYITNASFRTKKLPDDIPIQSGEGSSQQQENSRPLKSISEIPEEGKDPATAKESGKGGKSVLASLKDKDKSKLTNNLPLTGFVKKREKEKSKNGAEKKESDRRSAEREQRKQKQQQDFKESRGLDSNSVLITKSNGASISNSDNTALSPSIIDGSLSKESSSSELQLQPMEGFSMSNTADSIIEMTSIRINDDDDKSDVTQNSELRNPTKVA